VSRIDRVLLFVALAVIPTISSSQVSTGTPPFSSFGGGPFDTVNLGNLNVHFAISVLNKAGRGSPFSYSLGYDSSVWSPATSSGVTSWVPLSNWGWAVNSPALGGSITTGSRQFRCEISEDPPVYQWVTGNYISSYVDPLGTSHRFTLSMDPCETGDPSTQTAMDGSGWTLTYNGGITALSRGGVTYVPAVGGVGSYTDTNGNQITANSSGQFFDTLSSTTPVLTQAGSGTPSSPTTLTYTAPSGGNATYTVNFTQYTVATKFNVTGINEYGPLSKALVHSITLPDSSSYTFTYEPTPGSCTPLSGTYSGYCTTARIASVTLPTGGTITYAYSGGSNGIESDGSTAGLTRTLSPGGAWQYARTQVSGTHWQTQVSSPPDPVNSGSASDVTVIDFQQDSNSSVPSPNFYETQRTVNQGASTLLATVVRCYNTNYANCTTTGVSSPITQMDVYRSLPNGSTRASEIKYNAYGLVTSDGEFNYGVALGAAPSSTYLLQLTNTSYATLGNGIVDKVASVAVNGASGHAATSYTYDGTAVVTTSGTPQHISVTGSRGNLTTAATQVNATASLYRQFTYYDTGMPKNSTDLSTSSTSTCTSNPSTCTTYNYSSTNNASCGNSFITSVSEPMSLSRSITWNCTGGISTQVTDENGNNVKSSYTDPDFWRPGSVYDQLNNQTTISYVGQTAVEAALQNFNSGNSVSDSRTTVDGFGRPILSQRLQGPGATNYDTVEIDYDNMGRPSRSTMPFSASAGTTNPSAPATTNAYDALGRPLSVSAADGGKISYVYTNNDVLQTVSGTQTFQKQLEYDGFGRLTSVCEISSTLPAVGTCGQSNTKTGLWTQYSYDALGNLLTVTQNAQAASGSQQTRTFAYDYLGRVTSESNPETGNSGTNGTITYTYDSISPCADGTNYSYPGNLVQKKDNAGNFTCYAYDALHRLVKAGNSSVSNTILRKFFYDSESSYPTGVTVNNGKTHMVEAQTFNTSNLSAFVTDEFFSYSARGETTDVYEATPHSGSGVYYHTTATFWPTGTLKTLSGIPGVPSINYGANGTGLDGEGRYTQVSASSGVSPVSSVTYSTSSTTNYLGALTGLTFGSADSDSFTYDPNTGRLNTYTFTVNTKTDKGTLTWNTNGTLQQLAIVDNIPGTGDSQTCNYQYDDVQRISSSACGSIWSQNFTYDSFGNVTKSGSSTFSPLYSSTTNQFTISGVNVHYDANGNLLTDNLNNNYTWDPNWGSMLTVTAGSATVTATYDALGRMVENNLGGAYNQFVYAPTGAKVAMVNGTTLVKALIALPGGAKAVYNSSGLVYYRHSDWLGTSRLTSTATAPTAAYSNSAYAPFGEQYAQSGTADASFTGQDPNTSNTLYDFTFRRFSPSQGRWISPDPLGRGAVTLANPQSWNRYAYVLNNPNSLIDPLGFDGTEACVTVAGTTSCEWDYNPDDASDEGGDGIGGGYTDTGGGDLEANLDIFALGDCLGNQFGVSLLYASPTVGNGAGDPNNINGSATIGFGADQGFSVGTIVNDITSVPFQNMQQPSSAYVNQGTGPSFGFTNPGDPWTNYAATGMLGQAAVDVQIHELGNSIAVIQGTLPAQYPGQPVLQSPEQDPGATTLNCYQKATGTL
jgi:RHS repeat-associated protein